MAGLVACRSEVVACRSEVVACRSELVACRSELVAGKSELPICKAEMLACKLGAQIRDSLSLEVILVILNVRHFSAMRRVTRRLDRNGYCKGPRSW